MAILVQVYGDGSVYRDFVIMHTQILRLARNDPRLTNLQ